MDRASNRPYAGLAKTFRGDFDFERDAFVGEVVRLHVEAALGQRIGDRLAPVDFDFLNRVRMVADHEIAACVDGSMRQFNLIGD